MRRRRGLLSATCRAAQASSMLSGGNCWLLLSCLSSFLIFKNDESLRIAFALVQTLYSYEYCTCIIRQYCVTKHANVSSHLVFVDVHLVFSANLCTLDPPLEKRRMHCSPFARGKKIYLLVRTDRHQHQNLIRVETIATLLTAVYSSTPCWFCNKSFSRKLI